MTVRELLNALSSANLDANIYIENGAYEYFKLKSVAVEVIKPSDGESVVLYP